MSHPRSQTDLPRPSELMRLLGIEFDEITATRVSGSVVADERHHQPWGLVHGGLYTAVIETFATTGAFEAVKDQGQQAVGVSNITDFLRPHRTGLLRVVAVPIQQGRTQQLWQVEISRPEDDKLIARGQVRLQNIDGERERYAETAQPRTDKERTR
jgi:1,4-dihydroxy-2-naphthoyl-CoA hydrolase